MHRQTVQRCVGKAILPARSNRTAIASPSESGWRNPTRATPAGSAICRFRTRRSATCRLRKAICRRAPIVPRQPRRQRAAGAIRPGQRRLAARSVGLYEKVGNVQVAQGDLAGALKSYRDSLAVRERLAQSEPGNAGWQSDLSVSYEKVGNVQVAQGDLAGALKSYWRRGLTTSVLLASQFSKAVSTARKYPESL